MVSRRDVLKGLAALAAGTTAFAGYALGIEPIWRLEVQTYRITPPRWPTGLRLRASVIADVHAAEPHMSAARIRAIAERANALEPDVHLLLGDYAASHRWVTRSVEADTWAAALSTLRAPLGIHAVLGNHDWWDDHEAQRRGSGPILGRKALERHGIPVYENDAVRLQKDGRPFWLAGLADQLAFIAGRRRRDLYPDAREPTGTQTTSRRQRRYSGIDDLPGTLARITDDAPVILMAHEPDIFPHVPERVAVTVSGHTHGGQVRLLGYSPVVPSRYGNRYAYGHIVEDGRNLVVSGGLGCSIFPVRFGMPPEIVLLDIGAA